LLLTVQVSPGRHVQDLGRFSIADSGRPPLVLAASLPHSEVP
jgi:hypothetical protein